jgi:hypothetical protein
MTFPRGYYIALFLMFIGIVAFGQDCCEFTLLRSDTILRESSISVIEIPEGKQAVLKFEDIPVVTITNSFDNEDTQMVYSTGWYNGPTTATGFTNNTLAYSVTPGSTLTFNWSGTKLEWFSEFKSTHGIAEVTVNGIGRIINLASANTGPGIVAEWNLPQGNYTIVIKVLSKLPIVHDGFRTTN